MCGKPEINVHNSQLVGGNASGIVVRYPKMLMTREEALRHAAWLVAVADPDGGEFEQVLNAVREGATE